MLDFERRIAYGFVVEKVNLTRATIKEAQEFKLLLEEDILRGHTIIIVDLSNCEFMDSTFIGVLVVTFKRLLKLGGSLKIVKPGLFANSILNYTGSIEVFEIFDTLNEALASIKDSKQARAEILN
ncbi:MAG: STAS domain-containing protein [Ignavibacterium sp.]